MKHHKMKMMGGVIKDKKVLDLMTRDTNMQKIKENMEVRAHIYDKEGKKLGTAHAHGKTPDDAKRDLNKKLYTNKKVKNNYQDPDIEEMKGWRVDITNEGIIGRIDVELIYRKA